MFRSGVSSLYWIWMSWMACCAAWGVCAAMSAMACPM